MSNVILDWFDKYSSEELTEYIQGHENCDLESDFLDFLVFNRDCVPKSAFFDFSRSSYYDMLIEEVERELERRG